MDRLTQVVTEYDTLEQAQEALPASGDRPARVQAFLPTVPGGAPFHDGCRPVLCHLDVLRACRRGAGAINEIGHDGARRVWGLAITTAAAGEVK